ncbi:MULTISPECIES: 5-formyltetrahydrofolate cyclo-ligase [Sporosarcina]|uniref:5-formyltetrahydrofolate cyclo-ligase n=1 Tax=Sporosarcina TaxID=1569 RepID=UPI000590D441|nr:MULTISPECIES: 5-formyltetrahydrofolate cyclo-ligase [Sporosarcina]WJY28466.1 5-formyltetrahydrofolate cyclo-ligase [Sporosarcina sp. 0.2-SM1T-5]
MEKSEIRKKVLSLLEDLPDEHYRKMSEEVSGRFFGTSEYAEAETVALTVSRGREICTRPIIEACWQAGKRVAVPKCRPADRTMQFRFITSFSQLETVYLDLQEPIEEQTESAVADDIDLIVVPGVAYSSDGYRIGYGGGYYDRFLEGYEGNALSLAFELQIGPSLPVEPFDIPVGKIITEERVIVCSRAE